MNPAGAASGENRFATLPSIDELLRTETGQRLRETAGPKQVTNVARSVVETLRQEVSAGLHDQSTRPEEILAIAENRLLSAIDLKQKTAFTRVINATGVIIHTNLGRAPLSDAARAAIIESAGYCTLEYDLETGNRGKRGAHAESLITELTGAKAAIIVNNCAAAAFLTLSVFAAGGEVIVSRGELVEIGGDFRVPDVLTQSGATLREVGTTNRTKLADYEKAVGENTRMILKVHPSNYRIVGFTAAPSVRELAELAHKHGLILFEDIGSGALIDLGKYGLADEPLVADSIRDGADIVAFSGDKLLGGPQSGIIAGRRELIEKIRKHPLYRVLRVDKLAYAALQATLLSYACEAAVGEIPVLRMIAMTRSEIAKRTKAFAERLTSSTGTISNLNFEISNGFSAVGGGSAPLARLETVLIGLTSTSKSADEIAGILRASAPPVIARIEGQKVLLDLRTVAIGEEDQLIEVLSRRDLSA